MGDRLILLADAGDQQIDGWQALVAVALFALVGFVIWRVTR